MKDRMMPTENIADSQASVSAMNPMGVPPIVVGKVAAPRLNSLDGKTIYLVDSRFDDSLELLKQIERWFHENMPSVTIHVRQLANTYAKDDPDLWQEIQKNGDAAILGVGHCSTCAPAVSTHAVTLETKYGVPTIAIHTDKFHRVVRSVIKMAGLPQAPLAFVPQPVMGKTKDELWAYVTGNDPIQNKPVMQEIVTALTIGLPQLEKNNAKVVVKEADKFVLGEDEDELRELFLSKGWTDQLPIVLPTEKRVEAMLKGTSRAKDEMVGKMQPTANRGAWSYSVEKVAVNAVMAGARPEYFPIILALAASGISARGSTSSSASAMVVVNGPIRNEVNMNCGVGAMGPYNHANATIGRAYGLLSQNLQGGSVPGETFMGSLGNGYTYNSTTFAENEERSPWEPFHVQKGFDAEQSTVSIFIGGRTTSFSLGLRENHWREHVKDMLVATDVCGAPVLLLDPIAARQFVDRGGYEKKSQVIDFIHDTAKMPAGRYWDLQLTQNYIYPRATFGEEPIASGLKAAPNEEIHMFCKPDVNVIVVGGESNGYWQIMGTKFRTIMNIDEWR